MTSLKNAGAFYDVLRKDRLLGPTLTQAEVDGVGTILGAAGGADWPIAWAAYALATAYHETAHTMQPIKEHGGDSYFFRMYDPKGNRPAVAARLGNTEPGDGVKFCGRGYPQVTGRTNYAKADKFLNLGGRLLADPDLMLDSSVAAKVMIAFMEAGSFTGRGCSSFLSGKTINSVLVHGNFWGARAIINGHDRADDIADYAVGFQAALLVGGWA